MTDFSKGIKNKLFSIKTDEEFNAVALEIFHYQVKNNVVYKRFVELVNCIPSEVNHYTEIPFLPIQFFKSLDVVVANKKVEKVFKSSGTTGMKRSRHLVADLEFYRDAFFKGWEMFYGDISEYVVLALLPSYVEQGSSSLVYMVESFVRRSKDDKSSFYLYNLEQLASVLEELSGVKNKKVLLIGVSYALLDLVERYKLNLGENIIVMETGGMKGRRKEMTKEELHDVLKLGFGVKSIHSEYGMTELLSQAYSKGGGIFETPPWMKVMIRDVNDPLSYRTGRKTGGVNIIDLANVNSCSFIATQDLGRLYEGEKFEILGRFDYSDVRGCNLMVSG